MSIKIHRPNLQDAPPWCEYFFNLVNEDDLLESLETSKRITLELICNVPASLEEYRYAEGKWSIKTVFSHVIDCERLYSFNAMCFSRKDNRESADIKRDEYALNSNAGKRTLKEISEEYLLVRDATIKLFSYMTDEMLDFKSSKSKLVYTPRSYGWMVSAHNIHHCNIIKDKYLNNV